MNTPAVSRRRHALWYPALALVLLALGVWIGRSGTSADAEPSTRAPDGEAANAAQDEPATVSAPGVDVQRPAVPLPPIEHPPTGAPPGEVLAALLPSARAGDAVAACRAALELLACDHADQSRAALIQQKLDYEKQAERAGRTGVANLIASNQIGVLRHLQQCRERPEALREDGREWLERAARMGHEESQIRYALGQSLGEFSASDPSMPVPWGFLSSPAFERWRRDAPAMIQGLVERGSMNALLLHMAALSGEDGPYHGLIADDPAEAAALSMLLQRSHSGHRDESLLQTLSTEERQRALDRYGALESRFLAAESASTVDLLATTRAPLESILQSGAGMQPCQ